MHGRSRSGAVSYLTSKQPLLDSGADARYNFPAFRLGSLKSLAAKTRRFGPHTLTLELRMSMPNLPGPVPLHYKYPNLQKSLRTFYFHFTTILRLKSL
jgi:hypothetical protein